jgi:pyridinium-3,5-bisthiocarboxylic acid mononucleotide nickel chelatase
MPKILYIEPYSGIAGDMFAGSTIGLLDDTKSYIQQINSLPIKKDFEISLKNILKSGISANHFSVELTHSHKSHERKHGHGRHLSEIVTIIEKAKEMSSKAKKIATDIFKNLAEAEAQIHGSTTDKVHFHEVGAIDAIVDICSAAILVDLLNVDKIVSSPISIGTGTVNTSHGILPIPAPATALILKDLPINKTNINSELTTPTGAAILKTIVDSWETNFQGKIIKSNYSAGTKDLKEITNILRTSLIQTENITMPTDDVYVVECNLDDYPGEHFTFLEEAIFRAGALDYIIIPGTMKKSRPGVLLQVICPKNKMIKITDTILQHTSTNGIRYREEKRIKLERKIIPLNTPFGELKVKLIFKNNEIIKAKPEQKDINKIALKTGKNYITILNEVNYYIHKWIISKNQ